MFRPKMNWHTLAEKSGTLGSNTQLSGTTFTAVVQVGMPKRMTPVEAHQLYLNDKRPAAVTITFNMTLEDEIVRALRRITPASAPNMTDIGWAVSRSKLVFTTTLGHLGTSGTFENDCQNAAKRLTQTIQLAISLLNKVPLNASEIKENSLWPTKPRRI